MPQPLTLAAAATAMLDAYGGDVPDWLRTEAQALADALERAKGAPHGTPADYLERFPLEQREAADSGYQDGFADALAHAYPDPVRILVEVSGGVVQDVTCAPDAPHVLVTVADYDTTDGEHSHTVQGEHDPMPADVRIFDLDGADAIPWPDVVELHPCT